MNAPHVCTCGEIHYPDPTYAHHVNATMVSALQKLLRAVQEYGRNAIHLHDELKAPGAPFRLTDFEWNNFTKLRFHALAFKVEGKPGYWGITHKGGEFLKGRLAIAPRVLTKRNHVVGHEGVPIYVREVVKDAPWFEIPDFDSEHPERVEAPAVRQAVLL